MNHNSPSSASCMSIDGGVFTVTTRDLNEGDELDDDYGEYDKCDWVTFQWEKLFTQSK
jgi:hypothetical protein